MADTERSPSATSHPEFDVGYAAGVAMWEGLREQLAEALREGERLRAALAQCQNTSDATVYRWAANALAGRHWHDDPEGQ